MSLSTALRSDQRDGARGPIRPAFDEAERRLVARAGEKVLARIAFSVIKRKRELTRANGHGASSMIPTAIHAGRPRAGSAGEQPR
jgi:hypothetical protein